MSLTSYSILRYIFALLLYAFSGSLHAVSLCPITSLGLLHAYCTRLFTSLAKTETIHKHWKARLWIP